MKFIIWLLVLFATAVAMVLAAKNSGYVLVVYPPYRIELSLSMFVLSALVLIITTYFSLRFIIKLMRLPGYVHNFREQRLSEKGRTAMADALSAYFEGRYAAAERAAVKAMECGEKSDINSVIAARSAHELREYAKRDNYLANTEGKSAGDSTMRLIARTEFLLDQKQPQLALGVLKELSPFGKYKHSGALHLELKAQQQARNWDGVLTVVAQLEKHSDIDPDIAAQIRQQAWLEKLKNHPQDLKSFQEIWKSVPDKIKKLTTISAIAASIFIQFKDCKNALQLLTSSLNEQWNSELIVLYGDCQNVSGVSQIEQAEKWLKHHSNDAGLLLALGKLCLHQGLWGKAQSYLDASNSLMPSYAAYTALGQLAEKLLKVDDVMKYKQLARTLE